MKKLRIGFLAAGMACLMATGCNNIATDTVEVPVESSSEQFKTASGKLAHAMTMSMSEALDAVSQYVDISSIQNSRSAGSTEKMEEIGALLPADLSTLTRRRVAGRSATTTETVTLEDELKAIQEKLYTQLASLIPDTTFAETLDYVTITDGFINVAGEASVPLASPNGIALAEFLNAVAQGRNAEDVIADMEKDFAQFDDEDNTRALYKVNTSRWPNNTVKYYWGTNLESLAPTIGTTIASYFSDTNIQLTTAMSSEHRTAILNAMNTWTSKTGGAVKFEELQRSGWNNFLIGIWVQPVVILFDAKFVSKEAGNISTHGCSTVGARRLGTFSVGGLFLSTDIHGIALARTCLHELGHTLGLEHEHQRADRDTYITVNYSGFNYDKIPDTTSKLQILSKRVKIGWWYVTLYYLGMGDVTNARHGSSFDFDSIMLYDFFPVKAQYQRYAGSDGRTKTNTTLSAQDIQIIKEMYK